MYNCTQKITKGHVLFTIVLVPQYSWKREFEVPLKILLISSSHMPLLIVKGAESQTYDQGLGTSLIQHNLYFLLEYFALLKNLVMGH